MDSSQTLRETVERAEKEVKELLAEVHASKLDRSKLETGLKEVQSDLKVLDIHLHKHDK
jgi:predicted RNase H-like nuclease (RuvC/YqgF family)